MTDWIQLRDLPGYSEKFRKWLLRQAKAHPQLDLLRKQSRHWQVNQLELAKLNDSFLAAEKAKSEFEHLVDKVDRLEDLLKVTNHNMKQRIAALESQINDLVAVTQQLTADMQGAQPARRPRFAIKLATKGCRAGTK